VIALAGVHAVERDLIMATLLEDALRRLDLIAEQMVDDAAMSTATALTNRLSFECGDGTRVIENLRR
jgi:hypothetical protein